MSESPIGRGVLRGDPHFAQALRGTATIAGFPFLLDASVRHTPDGPRVDLVIEVAPKAPTP